MADIKADEALWVSAMTPEGILERWLIADGSGVTAGDPVVELRIEGALHEIVTSGSGRLAILAPQNSVVEPGFLLATVSPFGTGE